MEKKVYEIFGKILISDKAKVDFYDMNTIAMARGLFVPKNLCYQWFMEYLQDMEVDYNSTFYKNWNDIVSKTRCELLLDQLQHYATTYGTDFTEDAWIPNDSPIKDFPIKELKVVQGITINELIENIQQLAYSGIALSEDTVKFLNANAQYLDIDKIQNRQLRLMCLTEDSKFRDGQECLLWILYKYFGISMLIKSKDVLNTLISKPEMLSALEKNKELLSSVFYRNKDVFMRFKKAPELHNIVNRIRKLAVKNHKPMPKSPWLCLSELTSKDRSKLFNSATIFKLVQVYNALINPTGYYIIRNGKAYFKSTCTRDIDSRVLNELLISIIAKVPTGIDSVSLPKGIELAMPTSEKNFIGEIPIGSSISCAKENTMIGIYWENSWGARDLDLHACTIDGDYIGWNADYRTEDADVIFSGDMTNAPKGASEILWFKKNPVNSIVTINEYNGNSSYKFRLFVAQEKATDFHKDYMVDPNNIVYETEIGFNNRSEATLGFFKDGKFIFHSCNIGNGRVPSVVRESILQHMMGCKFLTLREVLHLAGIKVAEDSKIKLTSKADLITFFSGSK